MIMLKTKLTQLLGASLLFYAGSALGAPQSEEATQKENPKVEGASPPNATNPKPAAKAGVQSEAKLDAASPVIKAHVPEPETADAQADEPSKANEPSAAAEPAPEPTQAPEPKPEPKSEPEPAADEEAPAADALPVAGYDGGFFIQSTDGQFKLKIGARIKTRYTFSSTETESDRENTNSFSVPYVRLYFSGHLFDKKLTYLVNPGFGGGNMKLVLAYADYAFISNILHLTFGQMKRPFSRNYLTSSGKRAFILAPTGEFGNTTDLGLQLSNNFTKVKGLEWALGIFNSASAGKPTFSGATVVTDDEGNQTASGGSFSNAVSDFRPALVLRVGYNNGVKGYHPTDFEGGGPRFGIALSAHTDFNANDSNTGEAYLSTDMILKLYGFSLNGGVYLGWAGEPEVDEDTGESSPQFVWEDPTFDRLGAFVQAQFLIAQRFEPVLRYGIINPDGDDNNTQEITVGFTIYVFGQNFKWENNFSTFMEQQEDADSFVNLRWNSQLQFLF
jgi:hypothetical protein